MSGLPWRSTTDRRRRTAAEPAAWPWRWAFPALMVGLALAIPLLGKVGADAVLRSNTGAEVESITDPEAPGYLAALEPTPIALVLSTDGDDALVGVTVLTGFVEGGGYVVTVPLPFAATDPVSAPLGEVYATVGGADGEGEGAVAEVVSGVLGVAIGTVETFPATFWEGALERGAPELEVTLPAAAGPDHPRGTNVLDPAEVWAVFSYSDDNQNARAAALRQSAVWEAYVAAGAAADEPADVFGPFEGGVPGILRTLAEGTVRFDLLPVDYVDPPIGLFVPGGGDIGSTIDELVRRAVPIAQPALAGSWPRLALLNGLGDITVNADLLAQLSGLDVQVTAVGNTLTSPVTESSVVHIIEADADIAAEVARAMGIESVRYEPLDAEAPGLGELADIVVTVGADWGVER